jgi:biotin-[acetyl-CoA-carboxylase] ligase BirA-like protein
MDPSKLQEKLQTRRVGQSIVFSHTTVSTNDSAKELAALGAAEGTVVVADTQTCGHGRLGREWISPVGGLWFSTILRPSVEPHDASRLVFVAGLAVAKALCESYDLSVATKWPNDVLANGKKVCGILVEMKTKGQIIDYVVLGVGINANFKVKILPEVLWDDVTTLETELGRRINLERLFKAVLEKLESVYDVFTDRGFGPVLNDWKSFACFLGRRVEMFASDERFDGSALDVGDDGSLILGFDDGSTKRVLVGDISIRTK